jgi:hypothetical protein
VHKSLNFEKLAHRGSTSPQARGEAARALMRKTLAVLATIAAVGGAVMPAAKAGGSIGAGALTVGAVAASPYIDGYIYGPLPHGDIYIPRGYYRTPTYHGPRVRRASVRRGSRIPIARVHHVTRAYRVFDPYYGGGPFYHHHYCCRYW